MKRVCTICARGGSKGVKDKNIRPLAGLPLLAHSLAHARQAGLFAHIAVSSDSDEILRVARAHGADQAIKRPDELAGDRAAKLPAIQHAVRAAEEACGLAFDEMVDLDATSPLRSVEDIRAVVALLAESAATNVITGTPAHRSPYFNLVEVDAAGVPRLSKRLAVPVVRRQDAPVCYDMNASIYAWKRSALLEGRTLFQDGTRIHVMPPERSQDIDTELDFEIVELIMRRRTRA